MGTSNIKTNMTSEVKADPDNLLLQAGVVQQQQQQIPVLNQQQHEVNVTALQQQLLTQDANALLQSQQVSAPPTPQSSTTVLTEEQREQKRRERLEQNRLSARESRKRKKTMIEELQRSVINLSRENKELQQKNEMIKRQLLDLGAKYPNAVPLHLLSNSTDQAFQPQQGVIAPVAVQQQSMPALQPPNTQQAPAIQ